MYIYIYIYIYLNYTTCNIYIYIYIYILRTYGESVIIASPTRVTLSTTSVIYIYWKKPSENISNKRSRIIGTLNRLKLLLAMRIKIMLYNTLLVPHINYCIMTRELHCQRIDQL